MAGYAKRLPCSTCQAGADAMHPTTPSEHGAPPPGLPTTPSPARRLLRLPRRRQAAAAPRPPCTPLANLAPVASARDQAAVAALIAVPGEHRQRRASGQRRRKVARRRWATRAAAGSKPGVPAAIRRASRSHLGVGIEGEWQVVVLEGHGHWIDSASGAQSRLQNYTPSHFAFPRSSLPPMTSPNLWPTTLFAWTPPASLVHRGLGPQLGFQQVACRGVRRAGLKHEAHLSAGTVATTA